MAALCLILTKNGHFFDFCCIKLKNVLKNRKILNENF